MDRETLKKWFRTGAKPTEAQFAELIDSFRHVDEKLKVSDVENLAALIAQKMTREDALTLHEALSKSISELEQLKATHEDVHTAIEQYHATQEWTQESNLNDYTDAGIYHFKGYRTNANDNLPIESVGDVVNIAFTLIVDAHEGKLEGSTHIPCIVSQTLFLGNRQGSETKVYVRNATFFYDGQPDKWESWRELMQTTYLGVLRETHEGETLKSATENGLYTGAFFYPSSTFDIFKLEVMNNYAMANKYGTANTVFQKITILDIQGADKELTRRGTWNGTDAYNWTKWEEKTIEIPEVNVATQTTLGIVKGSSTVEVQEDGSLHVKSDGLENAIADKIGVVKQGRNVIIEGDGSVNVDNVCYIEIDKNYSNGERNDIYVHFEPNRKLEDLKHEYNDIMSPGYTETKYKKELVPDDTAGSICFSTTYLSGVSSISPTSADVEAYIEPNSSSFKKGLTAFPQKDMYSLNGYVLCKMWGRLPGKIETKKDMLAQEDYSNIQVTPNFGEYPYLAGRWVVKVSIARANQYCHLSNIKLIDWRDKEVASFYEVKGENRVYGTEIPYDVLCDTDRFPLKIKADLSKYSFDLNVSQVTSGDFKIDVDVYSEDSPSGYNQSFDENGNFLNWENAIVNSYGRSYKVSGQKTTTYPSTTETVDLTRNIAIAKDGILFQSAVKSGEGSTLTTTHQELFIKFDESGNIVTNIGDFINKG